MVKETQSQQVVKVNGQKQQQLQFEQESANSWCVVCDMAKEVLVDMTYDGKIVWKWIRNWCFLCSLEDIIISGEIPWVPH